jgi:hypothetical protein
MAPKKAAVNLANLEALGAKRLAEILLELGSGDAGIKRRLRLELSAEAGAEAVAADIGKRLTTLRQARSFVDWHRQLVDRRSRKVGCCRPYAAGVAPVIVAQSSKALVRAAR